MTRHLSKTSMGNYLRETRSFLLWLYRNRRIDRDFAATLQGPRVSRADEVHPRRALSDSQILSLLAAARERPLREIRLIRRGAHRGIAGAKVTEEALDTARRLGIERYVIYMLAVWTGLRRSELAGLQWGMLRASPARLEVPASVTKNGEAAQIFLHPEALNALEEWRTTLLESTPSHAGEPEAFIFRAIPSMKVMRSDLAYAQIPYEIPGRGFVDFHALRKTFGTRMATQEIDQATRQKLMRHSDPTLTDGTYLDATHLALAKKLQEMPALGACQESRGNPG